MEDEDLSIGDYIIKETKNITKEKDFVLYDVCLTVSKQAGIEKDFVSEENLNIRGELN